MTGDLITEERQWRQGVEMVSHVNHSQIARVRLSLGITVESWRHAFAGRPRLVVDALPTRPREPRWRLRAPRRSAAGS